MRRHTSIDNLTAADVYFGRGRHGPPRSVREVMKSGAGRDDLVRSAPRPAIRGTETILATAWPGGICEEAHIRFVPEPL
jgi:hypothetical protein